MSFERAGTAYQNFINPNSPEPPYILNKAAQQSLGKILLKEIPGLASLPAGESREFHFTEAPWQEWLAKYHTQKTVERGKSIDGSNDFLTLSNLHIVEKFLKFSYEYTSYFNRKHVRRLGTLRIPRHMRRVGTFLCRFPRLNSPFPPGIVMSLIKHPLFVYAWPFLAVAGIIVLPMLYWAVVPMGMEPFSPRALKLLLQFYVRLLSLGWWGVVYTCIAGSVMLCAFGRWFKNPCGDSLYWSMLATWLLCGYPGAGCAILLHIAVMWNE